MARYNWILKLAQGIGANPSKFMGTRTNISFLGKGPTKNPLFQGPVQGLETATEASLGPKESLIGIVEDAMGYASAGKLNGIQLQALEKNLENIFRIYNPPVLPTASVTPIASGIEGLRRFPRETHKFFGRPLKDKDFSEIDRMVMEGKIPDARGRKWNLKAPKKNVEEVFFNHPRDPRLYKPPGTGNLQGVLDAKIGMSRAIARQLLLQDTRLNLTDRAISSLKLSKDLGKGKMGSDPLDMMKLFYKPSSMRNYDEFLNAANIRPGMNAKDIATRILAEVELLPNIRYAEGGLAEIMQTPRRGRVTHPGGYGGSKWTEMFRDLGKAGGSRKDFQNLYFKMKSQAVPIDPFRELTIHEMMMSGALPSELKHGGLAGILEV